MKVTKDQNQKARTLESSRMTDTPGTAPNPQPNTCNWQPAQGEVGAVPPPGGCRHSGAPGEELIGEDPFPTSQWLFGSRLMLPASRGTSQRQTLADLSVSSRLGHALHTSVSGWAKGWGAGPGRGQWEGLLASGRGGYGVLGCCRTPRRPASPSL